MENRDAMLDDYRALRAEILVHIQAQTTLISIALTATAAIGAVAFTTKRGEFDRLEILLILPIILCGLGLAHLRESHNCHQIGHYIRAQLWPKLGDIPSWEKHLHEMRVGRRSFTSLAIPQGHLSWLPGFFIFGVPSIAALVLNWNKAPDWVPWSSEVGEGGVLSIAWSFDVAILVLSVMLVVAVGWAAGGNPFSSETPTESARPPASDTPNS